MKKAVLDLSGRWSLSFAGHSELLRLGYVKADDRELSAPALFASDKTPFAEYPAEVPGNFELDIHKAGLGPDPYYGDNALDYQKYETYHLFYTREFVYGGDGDGDVFLRFEGIDTAADVYLNGALLMRTENAFIPYEAECGALLKRGENRLAVHIKPAKLYVEKYPKNDEAHALSYLKPYLQLRKPASATGWDIAPRFMCGGIWRGVSLIGKKAPYIDDVFIYTERLEGKNAVMRAKIRAVCPDGSEIVLHGRSGGSEFETALTVHGGEAEGSFTVENARLWYPKNYGDPELYDTSAALCTGGELADRRDLRIGIRTVRLDRSEENGGKFDFYVNGVRVFIMGTNWVPVDAFHSRDRELIGRIFPLLDDIGCNCVRCWGGGVYECEELFEHCDENGILIWQDMMMACGTYPNDEGFAERLAREAESVVEKYRNHPSLLLWSGDNECDQTAFFFHIDPNDNILTRKVLPEVVSRLDPSRPFLPSSPYIDETAFRRGSLLSEDHLWGPRDYYKGDYYRTAEAKFASETGYHGCPSTGSLKKFLSDGVSESFYDADGSLNVEWLVHCASPERDPGAPFSYRIPLMASQVKELLGYVPEDMAEFSAASQISQAEAMKYFVERMRLKKTDHGGIIWWNLIDCWPQISDAVVDWYGDKKLAYHVIKTVQNPVVVMAEEPVGGMIRLVADSELCRGVTVRAKVRNAGGGGEYAAEAYVPAHSRAVLCETAYANEPLILEWEYESGEGTVRGVSHYIADARKKPLQELCGMYEAAGYKTDV